MTLQIGVAAGLCWAGLGLWRSYRAGWFDRQLLPGEVESEGTGLFGVGPWVAVGGTIHERRQWSWGVRVLRARASWLGFDVYVDHEPVAGSVSRCPPGSDEQTKADATALAMAAADAYLRDRGELPGGAP